MLFCDGYPMKKLLPLDRIATANPCLGDYKECPMFKEAMARASGSTAVEFPLRVVRAAPSNTAGKERSS